MGAEKFFDIKCRASGLKPDAAVVVATIRALKMHGGVGQIVAGKPLDPALLEENAGRGARRRREPRQADRERRAVRRPVVVAINAFPTDTPAEIEAVREVALAAGARDAVVANHFADGGDGAEDLARAVWAAARRARPTSGCSTRTRRRSPRRSRRSRPGSTARTASTPAAAAKAARAVRGAGLRRACRSAWPRRQYRLCHDPALKGRPTGFRVPIREVRLVARGGIRHPARGEMRTMPGLRQRPGGERIDIDADGNVVGLF